MEKKNLVRNVAIGAAVVGAGVAAVMLSKKENREKLGKAVKKAQKKGQEMLSDLSDKKDQVIKEFNEVKSNIEKSTASGAKELKKEVDSIGEIVKEIKDSNKDNLEDLVIQVQRSIRNLKKDFERITKK